MPLSEREQKILDEIEKSLATEDPRFAEPGHKRPSKAHGSRARLAALIFVGGLVLLLVFFLTRVLRVGLLAFGGMVTGIVLLASPVSALMHTTKDNAGRAGSKFKRSMADWDEDLRNRFRRR